MLMQNIELYNNLQFQSREMETLGYLPVLDLEALRYFTLPTTAKNPELSRVSFIQGFFDNTFITPKEEFYLKDKVEKHLSQQIKDDYTLNRQSFIDNFNNHKYCVMFWGFDDSHYFMRFKDKNQAVDFLNNIDFFDQIIEHPLAIMY